MVRSLKKNRYNSTRRFENELHTKVDDINYKLTFASDRRHLQVGLVGPINEKKTLDYFYSKVYEMKLKPQCWPY